MNDPVTSFREDYRQKYIGPNYSGYGHFLFTVAMTSGLIAYFVTQLHDITPLEWLTVPLTFLYANFAEYFGHRGPMHHPRPGLRKIFERHSKQHHVFFTSARMQFDSPRDYKAVLFPPILVMFFLLAFGTPTVLLLQWLATDNIAWLFAITGASYFLNYELLHFAYHTPADSWISRLPGVAVLRRHHTLHHEQSLMSNYNFNITYPIADWIMGTLHKDDGK